jgi:hypothetical protein
MFYFFVDNVIQGCWGNQIGDVFYDLTVNKMRWPIDKVKLVNFGDYSDLLNQVGENVVEEISPEQILIKDQEGNLRFVVNGTLFAEGSVKHHEC